MTRLRAAALDFTYPGGVTALRGATLEVGAGELVAVVGPNGSGKSTLLNCLAGLLEPSAGAVLVDDAALATLRFRARAAAIAVVPQGLPPLPDVRVLDFVVGGRYARLGRLRGPGAADLAIARAALAATATADLEGRLLAELSGGQRQRALVARAVAQEAAIILADEPTSSLDPEHQLRVFDLLAGLAAAGKAVVVVTHDLALAGQYATRAAVMADGRVAHDGAVDSALDRGALEPVYGRHLHYGRAPGPDGRERPFALAWRARP